MSFGELLSALLGWLGQFVEFVFSFVPRLRVIPWNERGVRYVMGQGPTSVGPGLTWYWPWCTTIRQHHVSRCVLQVPPVSLETEDGIAVALGAVLVYRISDVVAYDADNFNTEENLAEASTGILRDAACALPWARLRGEAAEGTRLAATLGRRMGKALERYGVEVESCRPNDLVRLAQAVRVFGVGPAALGVDHA